jgi:hypothetical protein
MDKLTHAQHAAKGKRSTPCCAWHITYGGRCFNCGFDPHFDVAKRQKKAVDKPNS